MSHVSIVSGSSSNKQKSWTSADGAVVDAGRGTWRGFVRLDRRAEEADGGSALVQGYSGAWPITWRRGLLATGRSDQPAEATREYSAVPYVVCVTHRVSTVHYVH